MYSVRTTHRFDKSVEKMLKRGCDMSKLRVAIATLMQNGTLPAAYRPHKLVGRFQGSWECHIEPDWLLVWNQNDTEVTLLMLDTGTHSDLFG